MTTAVNANAIPRFVATGVLGTGQVVTANANYDGTTGTYVTLVTGATNGTRIDKVMIQAAATTTAGVIRFFVSNLTGDAAGAPTVRMVKEIAQTAATPSGTVLAFATEWQATSAANENIFILESGDILKASTSNSEAVNLIVLGGDY